MTDSLKHFLDGLIGGIKTVESEGTPVDTRDTINFTGDLQVTVDSDSINIDVQASSNVTSAAGQSYAELRAATGNAGQVRLAKGRSTPGDGGQGEFVWSDTSAADDDGTIVNPGGGTAAGWRRIYSGALNVKWYGATGDGTTDDSTAIQNAIDSAQAHLVATGASGTGLYTAQDIFIPKGIYKIGTMLEKPSYIGLYGENNCVLKGATSSTDILKIGTLHNTIEGICFSGGRRAIVIGGSGPIYGHFSDLSLDGFGGQFRRLTFRWQSGPSIALDASIDHRAGSQNWTIDDFSFEGGTLYYGAFDAFQFTNGRIRLDSAAPQVLFTEGAIMGVFVTGAHITVANVSCVGSGSEDRAWIEGTGLIRSWDFRRGEDPFVTYRVRTENMSYLGEPMPVDTSVLAQIFSYADVFTNTGKNLIEIYDDFPAVISILRPTASSFTVSPRSYVTFPTDARVWIDEVSCPISEWGESAKTSALLDLNFFPSIRFYTSDDPTTVGGLDVTNHLMPYRLQTELQRVQEEPAKPNLWFTTGSGSLPIDPSWGTGTIISNVTLSNDTTLGVTVRKATSTTATDIANISYVGASASGVGWGDTPSYAAGLYCYSIYVKANFSGFASFHSRAGEGAVNGAYFDATTDWQRIWFQFYHDGTEREFSLNVDNIPGTQTLAGEITFALPMINEGSRPAPYLFPGFAVTAGAASGDIHRLGDSTNYGRTVRGVAVHTSDSGSVQNIGTVTLSRDGSYLFECDFEGTKSDGSTIVGTRRAKFKRVSGTTTQIGTTETVGGDDADSSVSAWTFTIDNSSDTIRFRSTSENTAVWQADWKMSMRTS